MAKATVTILCPSGHRRKAQMSPNGNLLQVLEDMCNQESLDSSEWGLQHQRKKVDLTMPWRLSAIPTNALLEMYKLDERRPMSDVTVQLQLPDNSRHPGNFKPSISLQEMLEWYRGQPESVISSFDAALTDDSQLRPVCSYMSEEVVGDHALKNTTIRELGLTSGAAVIRYHHRVKTDDELKKVNDRIDEKLARRHRQQQQQQQPPEQLQRQEITTTSSTFSSLPTTSNPSYSMSNTAPLSFNNEEYSVFRDRPVYIPTTTNPQRQPRTLAESLGINITFEERSLLNQSPQNNLTNFKFPEATKGQNLQQKDSADGFKRKRDAKLNDRHVIAYNLASVPSRSDNRSEDLPDSFFELTPDDLRSILNTLRQKSAEDSPLETRSMRDRVQSGRRVAYEHIVVRLVLNSNHILQALFYPEEPVSNLIEFARGNLICPQLEQNDFYLYTSPPRVILSDLTRPLSGYDLIPAAYVYVGHRKVSPLTVQLAPTISLRTIDEANQIVTQYVFSRTRPMEDDERPASSTTTTPRQSNTTSQPTRANPSSSNINDKHLRDKFRKFLPGQK